MANEHVGRLESVGLGIEATAGTAVAPQVWVRHLKNGFKRQTTKIENVSAMGRVENINDSAVSKAWAEGPLEGKVGVISFGYIVYSLFGTVVTTDHADTDATVKTHTADVEQSSTPKYLTVAVDNPVESLRHPLAVVDEFDITSEAGDWVTFSAGMKAKKGTASTETVAYITNDTEFTGKDTTIKLATNVAGLGAASALDTSMVKLHVERKSEPYFPLGSTDPSAMNTSSFRASGEFVVRYNSTAYEDDWLSNVKKALEIKFENTGVTIGVSAKPSLTFTAPKVNLTTFDKSDDLDQIITATVGFSCELSATDAYALRAVLVNTKASYVAA